MTDTAAATPATGATGGPISRGSDIANALEGILAPDDYLGPPSDDGANEGEAEAEPEVAEQEATEEAETEAEPDDEPDEVVEEPATRRYKVKANGEEREVTFDELKQGYQMGSDYRQKTEKLAEDRRQIEAIRDRYDTQLDQIIPALQAQIQGKFNGLDWVALAQEDPAEYTVLRAEFDQQNSQIQMAMAEKQYLDQQRFQEQGVAHKERLDAENKRLVQMYPVFGDPEKGQQVRTNLKKFLKNEGYSDDDLASLADARAVSIGYKAMLYDQSKERASKAKTASKDAPKVQKAGTPVKNDVNAERANDAAARVRKSGSTRDLADWLATQDIGTLG